MSSDVSQLLNAIQCEAAAATDDLVPLIYNQLRELAREMLAQEPAGQTLQATALVHEAYVRLVDAPVAQKWNSRKHFFGAVAEAMRRILIENARRKEALKRGGDWDRIEVSLSDLPADASAANVLEIDEALTRLAAQDPQAAELVKLRYFAGMSIPEAANLMGIAPRTADRTWSFARAWLHREIVRTDGEETGQ